MEKKIRAAIVGFGNIGKFTLEALQASEDFEVAGIVRRNVKDGENSVNGLPVVNNITALKDVDVAILCAPSREVEKYAKEILPLGINTVDSFDIHTDIPEMRKRLGEIARKAGKVSVISAGWDPGTDSIVRVLMQGMAPKGITETNFGPGMSMGHSVAVKAIEGVKDALSVTIPKGQSLHRRMVYVEVKPGYSFEEIEKKVKEDPYFVHDETYVFEVPSVDDLKDMGHGVNMKRKGVSGKTQNQLLEFNMHINNPALTAQILVGAARASMRLAPGCYTMIEIPVVDLLPGDRDKWIALV
ncbi:MAG: diaminopimelate dehydrogenase [Muribaculaceae bacterium]|nr:diaminopimelate dehydrogenase [Muribaculaceae bacterium]